MWNIDLRRTPRRRGARAFTLLEVLVAMAVLAIALVALYQAFISTARVNAATQGLWKAMVYSNNELARLERSPPLPVSVDQGDFPAGDPMAGYAWRREVTDESPFPGVTVRKVLLVLTWKVGGVTQSYRSVLYVQPT